MKHSLLGLSLAVIVAIAPSLSAAPPQMKASVVNNLSDNSVLSEIKEESDSEEVDLAFEYEMPVFDKSTEAIISHDESIQIIVSSNIDRHMDLELGFRVICPNADMDKTIVYESLGLDKYSYQDVALSFSALKLPLEKVGDYCQLIPTVYFVNSQSYRLSQSYDYFFVRKNEKGLFLTNQFFLDRSDRSPPRNAKTLEPLKKSKSTITVNVCAYWKVHYNDAGDIGDDYFTANTNKAARGVYLAIYDSYDNYVYGGYTSTSGCTGNITVVSGREYTVQFSSTAEPDGDNRVNTHYFYNTDDWRVAHYYRSQTWTSSGTYDVATSIYDHVSSIMAAASWAVYHRDGGMSDKVYTFRYKANEDNHYSYSENKIYLKGYGAYRKYIIAHELGHNILRNKRGGSPHADCSYDGGGVKCDDGTDDDDDHILTTAEKQSCALSEGWAHFYSATAWNSSEQYADCKFVYYKNCDYDDDGDIDLATETIIVNCDTGDYSPGQAWAKNKCDSSDYRSNERDWLMALWDVCTNYTSVSFNELLGALADIDFDWNFGEDNLYCRAVYSAYNYGFHIQLMTQSAFNGVDVYDANDFFCSAL